MTIEAMKKHKMDWTILDFNRLISWKIKINGLKPNFCTAKTLDDSADFVKMKRNGLKTCLCTAKTLNERAGFWKIKRNGLKTCP